MIRPSRRRLLLATAATTGLAACGEGTWLGATPAAPLPGERKSVLLIEDQLQADARIATLNVTLPPPQRNRDWPQSGGDATHAMQHLAAADTIAQVWRANIGSGASGGDLILAGPVVADGRLVAVDADGAVAALAIADGKSLWRFAPDDVERVDRLRGGAAAIADGRVYAVTGNGMSYGLDAASGAELWRRQLRTPVRAAPTVIDGKVLIPTADSQTFALDGATGEVIWQHAGLFEQAGILGGASPAALDGTVIAAYASGEIVALSLESGQQQWSETVLRPRRTLAIGAISDIVGDPVISDGRVIVAGASGEMAAFDLVRGEREWTADVTSTQTPWVAGNFIYVLTERNELVCLLLLGGRVRWVSPLDSLVEPDNPDSRRIRWAGPVLVGDRLLLASSEGELVSVSPYTGEILGKTPAGSPVTVPPAIADGTVYYLTDAGDVLALR